MSPGVVVVVVALQVARASGVVHLPLGHVLVSDAAAVAVPVHVRVDQGPGCVALGESTTQTVLEVGVAGLDPPFLSLLGSLNGNSGDPVSLSGLYEGRRRIFGVRRPLFRDRETSESKDEGPGVKGVWRIVPLLNEEGPGTPVLDSSKV